jgi:hypothetical protein
MNNFVIAFMVPPMLSAITWGTYIFFAVWTILGGLFIYFLVPETKGKTLEEMDQVFGSHTSSQEREDLAEVQRRVGLVALLESSAHASDISEDKYGETVKLEDINSGTGSNMNASSSN